MPDRGDGISQGRRVRQVHEMKLLLDNGTLYADGIFFCYTEAGNGRETLQPGRYPVEAQYSHAHGQDLPRAAGLGWIGPANNTSAPQCNLVLGRVRKGDALLPCSAYVGRLLAMLETAESFGKFTELVVAP